MCRKIAELGIPRVIVPPGPANFSAFGMMMADVVHDFSRTQVTALASTDPASVNRVFDELMREAAEALAADGFADERQLMLPAAQMRYEGQEHAVTLPLAAPRIDEEQLERIVEDFSAAHDRQYGHSMDDPVEIVTVRVRAVGLVPRPELPRVQAGGRAQDALKGTRPVYRSDGRARVDYPIYSRALLGADAALAGPAIIEEDSSTTVIHAGDTLRVGAFGELVIEIREGAE